MGGKMVTGKCHVCGEVSELSFEHVPPESCFNSKRNRVYRGLDVIGATNETNHFPWEIKELESEHRLKHEQKQRGVGWNTLCEKCNNSTGRWYAKSYGMFIRQGYFGLKDFGWSKIKHQNVYMLSFRDIYPLRVIKQIFTMFCSINGPNFTEVHPDIREFILDRESVQIDKTIYATYLYISLGNILRYIGKMVDFKVNNNFEVLKSRTISELTTLPYGHVMEFNPNRESLEQEWNLLPIFTSFKYSEMVNLDLSIPAFEVNTNFPLDYRTKDEIKTNRELDK